MAQIASLSPVLPALSVPLYLNFQTAWVEHQKLEALLDKTANYKNQELSFAKLFENTDKDFLAMVNAPHGDGGNSLYFYNDGYYLIHRFAAPGKKGNHAIGYKVIQQNAQNLSDAKLVSISVDELKPLLDTLKKIKPNAEIQYGLARQNF